MSGDSSLSVEARLALSLALTKLPDPQFNLLVYSLQPPPGILPSNLAAQGDRAVSLLQWAENSGPGLAVLQQTLAQITGERVSPGVQRLTAPGQAPPTPETTAPESPLTKMKILILAANPKNTPHLRLDQEVRDIEEDLTRAQQRDRFELVQRWAARPRDVQRAILELNPQMSTSLVMGRGRVVWPWRMTRVRHSWCPQQPWRACLNCLPIRCSAFY